MWSSIKKHFRTTKSINFTFKWTLENYNRLYDEDHPWKWTICSNQFSPPNNKQFGFEILLYPKGDSENVKDYMSIAVCVCDMPQIYEGKIKCRFKVSIENENENRCWIKYSENYLLFCNEAKVISDFIQYSSLLNCSSQYLPNDKLTLHFNIHLQADERIFNVITNNEMCWGRFDCANKVTKVVHTWTVENFGELFGEGPVAPYFIQSNNIPALEQQCDGFCLRLYANGWSDERKDWIDIAIRNENQNSATVQFRLSILDVDGEKCLSQEGTAKMNSYNERFFGFGQASLLDNSNGFVVNNKLRIHCEMSYVMDHKQIEMNNSHSIDTVDKSESSLDVLQKTFHFVAHKWTIDKFSTMCLASSENHSIFSQIFEPSTDPRYAFQLQLWPNGHDEHTKNYLSLGLCNVSTNISQVPAQYRISILGSNGEKWTKWGDQATLSKNHNMRKSHFVSQLIFQTPSQINQYLPNDNLTILCELWVIQDRKVCKTKPTNTKFLVNNSSGSTSVNMSNSNFQNSIVNILGGLSLNDFNVNTLSNDDKLIK